MQQYDFLIYEKVFIYKSVHTYLHLFSSILAEISQLETNATTINTGHTQPHCTSRLLTCSANHASLSIISGCVSEKEFIYGTMVFEITEVNIKINAIIMASEILSFPKRYVIGILMHSESIHNIPTAGIAHKKALSTGLLLTKVSIK